MTELFYYGGAMYPDYIRRGNAMQFIEPVARQFCTGRGLDIGGGKWPLPGAILVDQTIPAMAGSKNDAMDLPFDDDKKWDYIFSSHCLEHLPNPVAALAHWKTRLKPGAPLFLHLPHPDMTYWLPQNCIKHLHSWYPMQVADMLGDLGYFDVIHSERDMCWSFSVVGWKGEE